MCQQCLADRNGAREVLTTPNCCGRVSRTTAVFCASTVTSSPAACGVRTSTASPCRCGRRNTRPLWWLRSVCSRRCMTRSGCTATSRRSLWSWASRSAACSRAPTEISSTVGWKGRRCRYHRVTIISRSRRRIRMNWKPELDDLARREAFAREMGGVDKVKRQRDQGRLTVRERIDRLVDREQLPRGRWRSPASPNMTKATNSSNSTPANCVFGRGQIDGRPVVVVGDDFTVRGGSADASIAAKPLMAEEMAHRLPPADHSHHRRLGRRRFGENHRNQGRGQSAGRHRWHTLVRLHDCEHGRVPVVGLGLGSVAGLGAARLAASHYSVMTKKLGDVRRGPAGGETARPGSHQAGTRRRRYPDPRRRRRSCCRYRGRSLRLRPALPVLSAVVGLRAAADRPLRRRSGARARNR